MNPLEIEIRLAVQLSHVMLGIGIAALTLLMRSSEAPQLWRRKHWRRLRASVCSFIRQQARINPEQDARERLLQLQRKQAVSAEHQRPVGERVLTERELPQTRYEAERIPQILEALHILQEADNVTLLPKVLAQGEASVQSMTSDELMD